MAKTDWVNVDPSSGTGGESVNVEAEANSSSAINY